MQRQKRTPDSDTPKKVKLRKGTAKRRNNTKNGKRKETRKTSSRENKIVTPNTLTSTDVKVKPQMLDPIKAAKEASTMMDMSVAQKWKLPVLGKSSGESQKKGFFGSNLATAGIRRSSDTTLLRNQPMPTLSILTDIAQQKKKRMEQELRDKLTGIRERVEKALRHAGIEENEDNITFDKKQAGLFPIMSLEARTKRERVDERRNVIININEYIGACKERYNLMDQVGTWISYIQDDMGADLIPDENYVEAMAENEVTYDQMLDTLYIYNETTERLTSVSQLILRHIRKHLNKKERHVATKITVLDDHALLSSNVKWDVGFTSITKLLEDATKWVKAVHLKNALKNGRKQYAFLVKAVDRRLQELNMLTRNYEDAKAKIALAATRDEAHLKDQSEARREILNLKTNLDDILNQLKMAKDRNEKLLLKVGRLEVSVRDLKEELAKPPPTPPPIIIPEPDPEVLAPPPPKTPTPPPLHSSAPTVSDESRDKIERLEDQISDYHMLIGELQDRTVMLESSIIKEQSKVKTLRNTLEKSNKMLNQAQLMNTMPTVPAPPADVKMEVKMEVKMDVSSDSSGGGLDAGTALQISEASANYYKTLITGIKKDFVQELDKMKEHVKKQGTRTEAAVRRAEHSHKDHLGNIQKDAIRLLRALMHFRDQIAIALDKEGHGEAAQQLQTLPKLIPDNLGTDAKDILSHMAGGVVEFLHNIENILIHTLMSIRIMNKFTGVSPANVGMMKQMVDRVQNLKIAKKQSTVSVHRIKTKKTKMMGKKRNFQAEQKEEKYSSLMDRYKVMWNMFLHMTKEMDILEFDFEETLEETIEQLDPLLISQIKGDARKFKDQQAGGENRKLKEVENETQKKEEFRYLLNARKQHENIKILDRGLEEKKIAFVLYEKAKNCLKEGLKIPEKRFQSLVQCYVAFKALQASEEKSKKLLGGDIYLPTAKRPVLQKLIKKIKIRLTADLTRQKENRDFVEQHSNVVTKEIWIMCGDILKQTGITLVLPVVAPRNIILPKITPPISEKMKKLLKRKSTFHRLKLPPILHGNNIHLSNKHSFTNLQKESDKTGLVAMVTTPLIVDLEVNKERITARRMLKKTERGEVPLAKTRSYHLTQDWRMNFINEMI